MLGECWEDGGGTNPNRVFAAEGDNGCGCCSGCDCSCNGCGNSSCNGDGGCDGDNDGCGCDDGSSGSGCSGDVDGVTGGTLGEDWKDDGGTDPDYVLVVEGDDSSSGCNSSHDGGGDDSCNGNGNCNDGGGCDGGDGGCSCGGNVDEVTDAQSRQLVHAGNMHRISYLLSLFSFWCRGARICWERAWIIWFESTLLLASWRNENIGQFV